MSSLRALARTTGIPLSSLSRLRDHGAIAPTRTGHYNLGETIRRLFRYYRNRDRFAFGLLRRYHIFNDGVDVLELPDE